MTEVTPHPLKTQGFHNYLILLFYDHPAESVLFYFFSRQSTITSKDSLPGIFPSLSAKQKSPLIGKVPMQEHFPPKLLLSADALYVVLHIPQVLFQFLFSYVSDPHITMPILHPNSGKPSHFFLQNGNTD